MHVIAHHVMKWDH